jgi:hypothetical protein
MWLRDTTAGDIALANHWRQVYQTTVDQKIKGTAFQKMRYFTRHPDVKPFASAYFWAPFIYRPRAILNKIRPVPPRPGRSRKRPLAQTSLPRPRQVCFRAGASIPHSLMRVSANLAFGRRVSESYRRTAPTGSDAV